MEDIWILENIGSSLDKNTGKTVITLYSRNLHNRLDTVEHHIKSYKPYFYIPADEKFTAQRLKEVDKVEEYVYKDALGRRVRKCFTHNHYSPKKIKDEFTFTSMADFVVDRFYTTDIKLKYAYTIDKSGRISPVMDDTIFLPPRIMLFDIEIRNPKDAGVPMPTDPKWPIVSIQIKDTYTNAIRVFTFGVPQQDDPEHTACKTEEELFRRVVEYVELTDPDLLTGWNTAAYDIPYIIQRSRILGVDITGLARYQAPRCNWSDRVSGWLINIPGRSTVDMMIAFKKFTAGKAQRESYSLKAIISDKDLLKEYAFEYIDYGPKIDELFTAGRWKDFLDYCKYDVIALDNINKKLGLFDFYENLRKVTGCRLDDVMFNSKIIEMFLMHKGMKPLPTRQEYAQDEGTFQGATVVDPIVGLHDWVATFDLASLYPNIIIGFNLSPDIDHLIPTTLKETLALRDEMRALRKKDPDNQVVANMEMAYKFLNNSFYGVMGLKTFRLYNKEIAAAVTRYGRELNEFLQQCARNKGYIVVAGDTDSIFIKSVSNIDEGLAMETYLNDSLSDWSFEHASRVSFELKFEKLYKKLFIKKKKMYCGHLIWEEGKDLSDANELNYKGIELKRSDQSILTREILYDFLKYLLINDDELAAREIVKTTHRSLLNGQIDIHKVAIPKSVRSIKEKTPWARGIVNTARYLKYDIPDGQKPRLIYITPGIPYGPYKWTNPDTGEEEDRTDIMTEFCIDGEVDISPIAPYIDWQMIAEKTIRSKMAGYLQIIGTDFDHLISGQCTMDQWF